MTRYRKYLQGQSAKPARKTLPLEQCVDCSCDPRLSRPVAFYNRHSELQVAACMSCGRVELYTPTGDEPRGAGPVGGNNFITVVPGELREWLLHWPRLLTLGPESNQPIWTDCVTRCATWEELQSLIESQTVLQCGQTPTERFVHYSSTIGACTIDTPPDCALEGELAAPMSGYVALWRAFQSNENDTQNNAVSRFLSSIGLDH